MSQQQITTILFARYNTTSKEMEYHFTNNIYYVNNTDVIIDKEYKVQIDINPLNQEEYIRLAINTLRERQTAAWADAQAKVSQLEEQIKELQLITYQPDVLKDGEFQVKGELIYNIPEPEVIDAIQQTELDIAEGEWEAYPEEVITYGEPAVGTVQSMSFEEADELIVIDSISSQSEEFLKLAGTMKVIPLSNGEFVPVSEDDYKDA